MNTYPSLTWIRKALRYGLFASTREPVLAAYIIGSEAKGTARNESDIDIAVIIKEKRNVSSLKFTERFHYKYKENKNMPVWEGRRVDFQFFYPGEIEKLKYKKIPLNLKGDKR